MIIRAASFAAVLALIGGTVLYSTTSLETGSVMLAAATAYLIGIPYVLALRKAWREPEEMTPALALLTALIITGLLELVAYAFLDGFELTKTVIIPLSGLALIGVSIIRTTHIFKPENKLI